MSKQIAYIHSKKKFIPDATVEGGVREEEVREEVELLKKVADNDYIVRTKDGVTCHAIFNPFRGIYYADDKYGVVSRA